MWGLGILESMRVTMRNLLRGPITVAYPDETVELPRRARWAVAPKYDEDGRPKCTACTNCVRACPDGVLALDVTTREDASKRIDAYTYETGACMLCGLCVEACPFDALAMSHEYELAVSLPEEMLRTLLRDVEAAPARRAAAVVAPRAAAPGAPAAGLPAPQERPKTDGAVPHGQECDPVPCPEEGEPGR
ncbi:MAG: 4Fe-4S binding protein [Coriobacteriia bacterium]|nr:4Fe-4S binding protein [Coriobacteriia bacterium]